MPNNLTLEKITEQNVQKFKENLSKSDFCALRQRGFVIQDIFQPPPPVEVVEVNLSTERSLEGEGEISTERNLDFHSNSKEDME